MPLGFKAREGDESRLASPETGLTTTLEIPRGDGIQASLHRLPVLSLVVFPFWIAHAGSHVLKGKIMKKTSLLGVAALATSVAVQAQLTVPSDVVVVSGSRVAETLNQVPANVKIISREDISKSNATSIPQALSQIGGLLIRGDSLGQLDIGAVVDMGGYGATASSNTLVLLNGQKLNPIDSRGISWELVPMSSIDRIEILQGGASVQYGNGAVGGVINIITNEASADVAQVSVNAGGFGTLVSNAIFQKKIDDTVVQLSASASDTNGWRDNSATEAYALNGKISRAFGGNNKIHLDVFSSRSDADTPGGVVGEVGEGDRKAAKFNNIGSSNAITNYGGTLGGVFGISDQLTFEGEAFYRKRNINSKAPYYDTPDSVFTGFFVTNPSRSEIDSWDFSFSPRINAKFDNLASVTVGYDFNRSHEKYGNTYSPLAQQVILNNQNVPFGYFNGLLSDSQKAELDNHAIYGIARLPINKAVELSAGFRRQIQQAGAYDLDKSNQQGAVTAQHTYAANAGDLAINYLFSSGQKIYLKWNRSFRFANIDEFWSFDANSNRTFSGLLKPQISRSLELGGDFVLGITKVSGSIFYSKSYDEIRYNPATFNNSNDPEVIRRKGVAFDTTTYLTSNLNVGFGGKYQKSEYTTGANKGDEISLVPDLTLNANVNYEMNNWSLGGVINYVGDQYYDASPTVSNTLNKMPAYTVTDLYAGYKNGSWETRLTVKNAANENYSSYGGYGFVTFPAQTGQNAYYYYPSDPRAYYLTVKYTF